MNKILLCNVYNDIVLNRLKQYGIDCIDDIDCKNLTDDIIKQYEIIIPTNIKQQIYLKKKFAGTDTIIMENVDVLNLFNRKDKFDRYMNAKYPSLVPITYRIVSNKQVKLNNEIIYPAILKPNEGSGGENIKILYKEDDINLNDNYLIQEYILDDNNSNYTTNIFVMNGKIIYSIIYKDIKKNNIYHIKNGRLIEYIKFYDNNDIISQVQTMFEKKKLCNFTGILCLDIKIINGHVKIIEVNSRIGWTILGNTEDLGLFLNVIYKNMTHKK